MSASLSDGVEGRAAFDRLFTQAVANPNAAARIRAEKGAILDLVKGDLDRLRARTSSDDFAKIKFWTTPTAKCATQKECIPYYRWVSDYIAVIGGR